MTTQQPLDSRPSARSVLVGGDERIETGLDPTSPLSYDIMYSLLLLSDSALPLGSFAFSSGLESFLGHNASKPREKLLQTFLLYSIASVARSVLPYLLEAHRDPQKLRNLDNDLDAMTLCSVVGRASTAQGQALLTVWEKSFRSTVQPSIATQELSRISLRLKSSKRSDIFRTSAHLPPIFGIIAKAFGIDERTAAYVFLLNHAKAVLSAAVRSGVIGPFQSHAILCSRLIREDIEAKIDTAMASSIADAGQVWVAGDVWVGRHELLYSRIFNS